MIPNVKLDYRLTLNALKDRGYSLASWARLNGFKPSTAYDSARGRRDGIVARRIRRALREVTK